MVPAVAGSVGVSGYIRVQAVDSVIVTEQGYGPLASHPKSADEVIVG